MPSCVLRVSFPTNSQLESTLRWLPLETLAVFKKGALPRPTAKRVNSSAGLNVLVSEDDDGGMDAQVADAEAFVNQHQAVLQRLVQESEATMCLDFGRNFPEHLYSCSNELPVSLLRACAALQISIVVTIYPPSSDD